MNIYIYPKGVFISLLCLVLALLFLNVVGIISSFYVHSEHVYDFVRFFDFDRERNIPAISSSVALFFSGFLLFVIAMAHKKNCSSYFYWLGLAVVFSFLSVDEMLSIHERFSHMVRYTFNMSGFFYFSWVVPYGMALMMFLVFYFNFLMRLPRSTMVLFVVSGVVFVSGAIGFEMLAGRYVELHGKGNLIYSFFYTCEEFLEMLGIVIFIYALLMYMIGEFKSFAISLHESKVKSVERVMCTNQKITSIADNATEE